MKKTLIAAAGGLVLLLGACNNDPDKSDFKKQTADFINKDGGDVETKLNTKFSGAKCDEPASTTIGTQYQCTATAEDGTEWTFDVEVTSKNGFTVNDANPTGGTAEDTTATT